jgi:hypothetical protein
MSPLGVVIDKWSGRLPLGVQVLRQSEKGGIIEIWNRGGS